MIDFILILTAMALLLTASLVAGFPILAAFFGLLITLALALRLYTANYAGILKNDELK